MLSLHSTFYYYAGYTSLLSICPSAIATLANCSIAIFTHFACLYLSILGLYANEVQLVNISLVFNVPHYPSGFTQPVSRSIHRQTVRLVAKYCPSPVVADPADSRIGVKFA